MRESRGMFSHDKGMSRKLFLSQLPKPYHEAKVLREYAFTDWEIGQLPETTP